MGGSNNNSNRQRKSSSSSSLMSIFNIFRSSRREEYYSSDEGTVSMGSWTKVWPSDEDRGQWGAAEPDIDMKAAAFIARYKKKVTESEVHHLPPQLE